MQGRLKKPLPWTSWKGWCAFCLSLVFSCYCTLSMPDTAPRRAQNTVAVTQGERHSAVLQEKAPERQADIAAKGAHKKKKRGTKQSSAEKLLDKAISFGRLFFFVGLGAMLGGLTEARRWYLVFAKGIGRLTSLARLPALVTSAMPAALASGPAADSMIAGAWASGAIGERSLVAGAVANSFLAHLSHSLRVLYPVVAAIGLPGLAFFGIQVLGGALVVVLVFAWHRVLADKEAGQEKERDAERYTDRTAPLGIAKTLDAGSPETASMSDAAPPRRANSPDEGPLGTARTSDAGSLETARTSDAGVCPERNKGSRRKKPSEPLPWDEALKKSAVRALALLFRLFCISVPMVLAMEWALRSGCFGFWETMLPRGMHEFLPEQVVGIVAAQMGGLVQSSAFSAGLLSQGLVTPAQVLLAMLLASAVGNPLRTLRRNLPTAMAIFPTKVALVVVLGMQAARLLVMVGGMALTVLWMQA